MLVIETFVVEMLVIGVGFIVSVIVKSYHYFERITFGTRQLYLISYMYTTHFIVVLQSTCTLQIICIQLPEKLYIICKIS